MYDTDFPVSSIAFRSCRMIGELVCDEGHGMKGEGEVSTEESEERMQNVIGCFFPEE